MADILIFRPSVEECCPPGVLLFRLDPTTHLVVTANHECVPTCKVGKVDWSKVTRVKVIEVRQT